jgi:hypothetical protein
MDCDTGLAGNVFFRTGSVNRWSITKDAVAESGAAVGSDFNITAYNDAGSSLGVALSIARASRVVNFPVTPTVAGVALGTAALQNTGTSGANVPLLNVANTWSARQTGSIVSAAAETFPIALSNADNTAATGVGIDFVTNLNGFGVRSAQIVAKNVSASETQLVFRTAFGSVAADRLTIAGAGQVNMQPSTVTPAGGGAGNTILGSKWGSAGVGFFVGGGAPTLSAGKGSIYVNVTAATAATRVYVNTDGATTWTNLTAAA